MPDTTSSADQNDDPSRHHPLAPPRRPENPAADCRASNMIRHIGGLTQGQRLLAALQQHPLSLNQTLALPGLAAEYRRTMTDLRKLGYVITHHRAKNCAACEPAVSGVRCPAMERGENVYRLEGRPPTVEAKNGQLFFV